MADLKTAKTTAAGPAAQTALDTELAKFANVDIKREGKHITIPDGMSLESASIWISRRMAEEEQTIALSEPIEAYPLDGAHAFLLALSEMFGWAQMVPTPGFWGSMDPPQMLGVDTGPYTTVQVPWGRFQVPTISGYLETSIARKHGRPVFCIQGEIKRKHQAIAKAIADLTRAKVKSDSLYRGKAVRMHFPDYSAKNFDPSTDMPRFMDLYGVNPNDLIFSDSVRDRVEVSVFTPITKTDLCRTAKIPLKRGVLLAGPWGVGKTLTAYVVAKLCEENNWTFIYLQDVEQLANAIQFARQYQPCVIFAEDIDRVAQERDDILNTILNTIDGVDSKTAEVMVVLTTNHLDTIDASMLRPGRLDSIIQVTPPDAKAAETLVRRYAGNLLSFDADLSAVGGALTGKIPSAIREAVERSKLASIRRMGPHDTMSITPDDLLLAARDIQEHIELLTPPAEDKRSDIEKAAEAFGTSMGRTLGAVVDEGVALRESVETALDKLAGAPEPLFPPHVSRALEAVADEMDKQSQTT